MVGRRAVCRERGTWLHELSNAGVAEVGGTGRHPCASHVAPGSVAGLYWTVRHVPRCLSLLATADSSRLREDEGTNFEPAPGANPDAYRNALAHV